ncbi:golgin candidate 5-like isoform X2 [Prosopis cineraria]|uniref:golgin candidate 5-like isoform X2 n=1 Tax=Prosopis cineraria TaxID=364024 RepID=UPI00240FF2ED|nr:golgin candidate 5-like isoform X2 [Prosopis cineraria]
MAWFGGKNTWGNFPDLAGAVNKLQESVKNIEKNFDTALGLEEKSESSHEAGSWPLVADRKTLFNPVMAFMGNKSEENTEEISGELKSSEQEPGTVKSLKQSQSLDHLSVAEGIESLEADKAVQTETDKATRTETEESTAKDENKAHEVEEHGDHGESIDGTATLNPEEGKSELPLPEVPAELSESIVQNVESAVSINEPQESETAEVKASTSPETLQHMPVHFREDQAAGSTFEPGESDGLIEVGENFQERTSEESREEGRLKAEESMERVSVFQPESSSDSKEGDDNTPSVLHTVASEEIDSVGQSSSIPSSSEVAPALVLHENEATANQNEGECLSNDDESDMKERCLSSVTTMLESDSVLELERVKREMKMMENALQGAARQAQAKADEIAKLMNENEQLKSVIEDLKRNSNEAEIETLREEYHQRVATLERKVYALTKERDTLRREQSKKSDAAALLKEKDEIINQVMAEGEELSKKQAAQESTIRKLRAQIRELEEEKKGLTTKLQVEENKVESIKRDKMATESLLQETIEKHQAELAAQKDYYTNALAAAKEAEALAETRINTEARIELESRLREAEERESMLIQALEELRQTLSQKEQQAVFKEDMLRRDIEDLQKRYQESERRCEELIAQVPESTRPLLRQIEAIQETNARRAEAWATVERTLNSRVQEAEAKATAAEERERSMNERLSQTLSRINVLEAQISCLRAEQVQLSRSLEKERQRAAENRQEYLAAKEEADTQEGRLRQLEDEIRELRQKHKQELQESLRHRELLQQEIEREKAARADLERSARVNSALSSDQTPNMKKNYAFENGSLSRKVSNASSLGSMEESYFLQASLDSSDSFSERRNPGEYNLSPYYMKSMTTNSFEAALRQKEGELASYMSRLASMESIRDSLAEELVKMTEQCEKLRGEAATLPGLRAELESLRKRHSAALELMGERDEELEELRADIVDLKEMYREQVDLLVNKIQIMNSSADIAL